MHLSIEIQQVLSRYPSIIFVFPFLCPIGLELGILINLSVKMKAYL